MNNKISIKVSLALSILIIYQKTFTTNILSYAKDCLVYLETSSARAEKLYYPVLSSLIKKYGLKLGAEIGVSSGGHSEYILKNTNVDKLYSIDPYMPYNFKALHADTRIQKLKQLLNNKEVLDFIYLKVNDKLQKYGGRSQLIRKTSIESVNMFKDEELDFVFIDGNHDYVFVKKDIEIWFNKVRSGGIISGDDYSKGFPGVIKAVNEFFLLKNIKLKFQRGRSRVWYVIKP